MAELTPEIQDKLMEVGTFIKDNPELAAGLGLEAKRYREVEDNAVNTLVDHVRDIFMHNGYKPKDRLERMAVEDGKLASRYTFKSLESHVSKTIEKHKDNFNRIDQSILMRKVLTSFVEMPVEPPLMLTPLFREVQIDGLITGQRIEFPAFGAMEAEELGPTSEYPEQDISADARSFAKWGKKGLAVRIPEEFVANSAFDIVRIHLELAGNALRRLKERLSAREITDNAQTLLDNSGSFDLAGAAESGTFKTSGNAADGTLNGTLAIHDVFVMYAGVIAEGFIPDILMMHPIGWLIFAQNQELRALAFQNGGNFFQSVQGDLGRNDSAARGGIALGLSGGDRTRLGTTHSMVPDFFPAPFRMIASPFLPFSEDARSGGTPAYPVPTVDMIMADSANVGLLLSDGRGVTTESWRQMSTDMQKTKFREYYGHLTNNNGKALKVAKAVKVTERGFDLEDRLRLSVPYVPAPTSPTQLGGTFNP